LIPTADLIETCFASTLDEDGREYLRQIRRAAGDPAYLHWMPGADERISTPLFGYVWEQDRRIVGNLSLIPIHKHHRWIYLIANVAVHPDYRRRGIARQLTMRALEHVYAHRVSSAWLQVRADNVSAYQLYRETGFEERSRRTIWINQFNPPAPSQADVTVSARQWKDWPLQRAWLETNYPPETTWNLPLDINRFSPGLWSGLVRWLNGDNQEHWTAHSSAGDLLGLASWEPQRGLTDSIWLAIAPEQDERAIRALLPAVRQNLSSNRRTITINYPAGRAEPAFYDCGFIPQATLVWMENKFG
jgi:ribosomal protein S18 acetylase RimI-like enzyme